MPKLQIVRPDGTQTDHELTEEILTIGRAPDNVFPIEDVSVSSHHAQISRSAGIYLLTDLGSTNGTTVNGKALERETEYTLTPGDKIRFGNLESIFDPDAVSGGQELPASEARSVAPASKSIKPSNFMNASPFQKTVAKKDTVGTAILVLAVVAILASLMVLWMAIQMQVS